MNFFFFTIVKINKFFFGTTRIDENFIHRTAFYYCQNQIAKQHRHLLIENRKFYQFSKREEVRSDQIAFTKAQKVSIRLMSLTLCPEASGQKRVPRTR